MNGRNIGYGASTYGRWDVQEKLPSVFPFGHDRTISLKFHVLKFGPKLIPSIDNVIQMPLVEILCMLRVCFSCSIGDRWDYLNELFLTKKRKKIFTVAFEIAYISPSRVKAQQLQHPLLYFGNAKAQSDSRLEGASRAYI